MTHDRGDDGRAPRGATGGDLSRRLDEDIGAPLLARLDELVRQVRGDQVATMPPGRSGRLRRQTAACGADLLRLMEGYVRARTPHPIIVRALNAVIEAREARIRLLEDENARLSTALADRRTTLEGPRRVVVTRDGRRGS